MIRALIFDFDGLILDTETPLIDAYGLVHTNHGVPFDRDLFLRSTGHADYAYQAKYGVRDHRGGGRSSARETIGRVAAGAVARSAAIGASWRHGVLRSGCNVLGNDPPARHFRASSPSPY